MTEANGANPLIDTVASILLKVLPDASADTLRPDSDLFAMGLDSVNAIELVLGLEDRFGISFGLDEIQYKNFSTMLTISDMIEKKLKK